MVDFALVVPPVHDNPVEHRRMLAMRANNSFPKTGSESMQAPLRLKVFEEGNEPDPTLWEGSVIYTDAGNVKFSDGSTWLDIPSEPISLDQLQDIGANTVLCRPSGSSGPILQQPLGTNSVLARGNGTIISLASPISTVLRRLANGVFGFGQLETEHLDDAIVTLAKLAADVGTLTSITTNTNGTSIRFQLGGLGVQVCAHQINLGSRIANGSGTRSSPYFTAAGIGWTFPQSFTSVIAADAIAQVDNNSAFVRAVNISLRTVTNSGFGSFNGVSLTDDATDVDVIANLWAIGTFTP